jgi:hypothetical protein
MEGRNRRKKASIRNLTLDAQREAAEAFIQSQRREGWIALPESYDDGGFTGMASRVPSGAPFAFWRSAM